MNKRKQEQDTGTDTPLIEPTTAVRCSKCHRPKTRTTSKVNGRDVTLIHYQVCSGVCTVMSCDHRNHKKGRAKRQKTSNTSLTQHERAAILAGFKPKEDPDFKQEWEKQLKQHGLDSDVSPSPHLLDAVIKAARSYATTVANKHIPPSTPTVSANAVVRLFETPSSSSSSALSISSFDSVRFQCTHCNYICDSGGVCGPVCVMCRKGNMLTARADAVFNPVVFQSAMHQIAFPELDQENKYPIATPAKEQQTTTNTQTTNTNTTIPPTQSSTVTHTNTVTTSTQETSIATALSSGTSPSPSPFPSPSPRTSMSNVQGKAIDVSHIDVDDLTDEPISFDEGEEGDEEEEEQEEHVMLPTKTAAALVRDVSTQTEPQVAEAQTQTQHSMEFKPLRNITNSNICTMMNGMKITTVFSNKKAIPSNKENITPSH